MFVYNNEAVRPETVRNIRIWGYNDMKMLKLLPAFIFEAALLVTFYFYPRHVLYVLLAFYIFLAVYFHKQFSQKEFAQNFKDLHGYWIPVLLTTVGLVACYLIRELIAIPLPGISAGVTSLWTSGTLDLVILAITRIVIGPIGKELLFRGAMISFDNKQRMILDALVGALLCSLVTVHTPLGIIGMMLIQLPIIVSYIKNRNIYVAISVSFIWAMWQNALYVGAWLFRSTLD